VVGLLTASFFRGTGAARLVQPQDRQVVNEVNNQRALVIDALMMALWSGGTAMVVVCRTAGSRNYFCG
jgi:hypothetical protein